MERMFPPLHHQKNVARILDRVLEKLLEKVKLWFCCALKNFDRSNCQPYRSKHVYSMILGILLLTFDQVSVQNKRKHFWHKSRKWHKSIKPKEHYFSPHLWTEN